MKEVEKTPSAISAERALILGIVGGAAALSVAVGAVVAGVTFGGSYFYERMKHRNRARG